ncbi:hypothetical protein [Pseudofrankia sp. BMG5.37]|uniref:hypothetical protein n=1 Tax=Pseudofrankia sp. BMG5.37 TaxID=3050035 RepID=UPI002895406C|nr:hypothetical protein [Pseudofrankia sp. BMG5.37]MDT3439744.1 hypothetical protein [Pseudofrankia sp. BMG5.37]
MTGHGDVTELDEVLGAGVGRLRRSAEARGQVLPVGPTLTTVALVALHRDAHVRAGLPEITPALAREILTGTLPTFAAPARDDLEVCPRVLKALADEQHDARLLSAKKLAKLHTAIDEATAPYEEALFAPDRPTWERFYARLMRDEGVEVTDEAAVRAWLARYRERPLADRKTAFLAATTDTAEIESTGTATARHARVVIVGQLSETVRSGMVHAVRTFYLPYLYTDDGEDESVTARIQVWVDRLIDGVTAAGLSKALRDEFRDLAPSDDFLLGPIVRELRDWREDYGGCLPPVLDLAPLALRLPVRGVDGGGDTADSEATTAALVRSAPLISVAADLARWVDERGGASAAEFARHRRDAAAHLGVSEPVMQRVAEFASAVSMLRVRDGRVATGVAWRIWREGDADDLLHLAVTSYAAVRTTTVSLAEDGHGLDSDQDTHQPADDLGRGDLEPGELELGEEDVSLLFELFGQQGTVSVARHAAASLDWRIRRAREPIPPIPLAAPEGPDTTLAIVMRAPDPLDSKAYALPSDDEIERLIGLDQPLDADERAELTRQAHVIALVVDRMAGLGLVRRVGDTVMLSRLGERVMGRLASQAGWDVPTLSEVATAEPALMARRLASWPTWARVPGLLLWTGARERERGWPDLLTACAASPGQYQTVFELLGVDNSGWARERIAAGGYEAPPDGLLPSPLPDAEAEQSLRDALRDAVADPTIGAYALAAWRSRGGQEAGDPPPRARAVLLRDRLISLQLVAFWTSLLTDDVPPGPDEPDEPVDAADDPLDRAVVAAFDEEVECWPGGGGELLRMLRDLSATSLSVLDGLATIARRRPDAAAQAAGRAAEPASRAGNAPVRPRPPAGGRVPSRRDVARRRERANRSAKRKGRS